MSFSPASQIGAVAQAPLDAPTFEALAADLEREGLPAWEAAAGGVHDEQLND